MPTKSLLTLTRPVVLGVQSLVVRITRGITFGVRGLVTDPDGTVLLVRHSYVPGWYLPGGAVEPGETALQSLDRELDEEAGVSIAGTARLHGLFFNERMARRDHVAVYHIPVWRRLRPFAPTGEIRECQLFPMTDLPEEATAATRARVAEHLGKAPVSAFW